MRVLIADDESIIRMGLKKMLQELGHEVFTAEGFGTLISGRVSGVGCIPPRLSVQALDPGSPGR